MDTQTIYNLSCFALWNYVSGFRSQNINEFKRLVCFLEQQNARESISCIFTSVLLAWRRFYRADFFV